MERNSIYDRSIIEMQSAVVDNNALCYTLFSVLIKITPTLRSPGYMPPDGKIAVIGGCLETSEAPYFAALSALKLGAFTTHVFCTKDAALLIKGYCPDIVVHPILCESHGIRDEDKASTSAKMIQDVRTWMGLFDCLVIGPGLVRDDFLLDCVSEIMKHAKESKIPMVVNSNGLLLLTNCIDLVRDYPLAVLTVNNSIYTWLVQKVWDNDVEDQDAPHQLLSLSKGLGGVTILLEGSTDLISDGEKVFLVNVSGPPRQFRGQENILSGSVAVFLAWTCKLSAEKQLPKKPTILSCIAASGVLRHAASLAFGKMKRSTLTSDIIEYLGNRLEENCHFNT